MEEYPSGQRGQTVNLLASPSMVRIHPPPPRRGKVRPVQVSHPSGGRLSLCSLAPPLPAKPEERLCGDPMESGLVGNFFASIRDPLRWTHGWGAALRTGFPGFARFFNFPSARRTGPAPPAWSCFTPFLYFFHYHPPFVCVLKQLFEFVPYFTTPRPQSQGPPVEFFSPFF